MEETDLSQLNDAEIMDMYSDIIESGELLAVAKGNCYYYCDSSRFQHKVCPVGNGTYYDMYTGNRC